MGQRVVAACLGDAEVKLTAALEAANSRSLQIDAGEKAGVGRCGVMIAAEPAEPVDVIIDFSTPAGFSSVVDYCIKHATPLVVATTGLSAEQLNQLDDLTAVAPILIAPSMSLAVNVAMKIVQQASRALKSVPGGVDVEIVERHHRFKEDAPSGTALHFGKIVAQEMGQTVHTHGREGRTGQRPRNEIGYHALRTGDNVGEHSIILGLLGETLEINVRSHTRDAYALGALAAAKFLAVQPPGRYQMEDVLGL